MKKFVASFLFIIAFSAYALSQYLGNNTVSYTAQSNQPNTTVVQQPAQAAVTNTAPTQTSQTPIATTVPTPTPTPVTTPVPVAVVKPKGMYVNGTYTGSAADAYYGMIQVKVVISSGKIADVQFVQYPNDRRESIQINGQAMPYLKQEAIQAQSAQVNGVSGATDTSAAFQQSLASALSQAKA
jgi:uncharacterized protein with FMN-binding domain